MALEGIDVKRSNFFDGEAKRTSLDSLPVVPHKLLTVRLNADHVERQSRSFTLIREGPSELHDTSANFATAGSRSFLCKIAIAMILRHVAVEDAQHKFEDKKGRQPTVWNPRDRFRHSIFSCENYPGACA